jgi:hypothetical protein
MAPDSGRNTAAYTAALKLGNYVAGAGLDEQRVVDALTEACTCNRLVADDGARSVAASIRSGLRNGKSRPRAVPPAPGVTAVERTAPGALRQLPGQEASEEQSDDDTSRSWRPVDLAPYVNGTVERPKPSLGLFRSDGLRVIYPGKEHSGIGEMESGKSWFANGCVAAELLAGNRVVYIHFEETDPTDTVERLLALGVPGQAILDHFAFVGPEDPVTPAALAAVLTPAPTLVVLDGVNEAMSLHRLAIREEDGAAQFRRLLIKPCTATGAATLALDHVVKDREKRGRDALGSVHKGNGNNGVILMFETAEPFGRGLRGRSHVHVVKDRPGHLRRHGRPGRIPGKTYLGELVVDDTRTRRSYLDLQFYAPNEPDPEPGVEQQSQEDGDDAAVLAVVQRLATDGKEANTRNVRAAATGMGKDRVGDALARLVLAERLDEHLGPRNAHVFAVAQDQD